MTAPGQVPAASAHPAHGKERGEANKLVKRLRRQVGQAIQDYAMIRAGDKVMVCLSGGKDSYTMLDILLLLREAAPVPFELMAVNLDQKQPDFPEHVLPDYLKARGVPYHIIEQDTYSVVKRVIPEGKTMCSLCSRLRRGALYTYAAENGFTKIALGHHRDDIVATFFLNMFHGSKLKAMPPKLMCASRTSSPTPPCASSPSSPATCAARRSSCSASRSAACWTSGRSRAPAASRTSSAPCKTWRHRNWPTPSCSTSPRSTAAAKRTAG